MGREPREDNAFVRSEKPRAMRDEEAKKPEGFGRAPRREAPAAPDTGFARGNFAKKDASEADTAKARGPRPTTGAAKADSGFGEFRNANAPAGGRGGSRGGRGTGRKFI